jgi:amino acid permease
MVFIMGSTWVVAYANPNILDLIEAMGAPIIASLLCLLPMYAIRKAPALAKYKAVREHLCHRCRPADHSEYRLQTVLIQLRKSGVTHD